MRGRAPGSASGPSRCAARERSGRAPGRRTHGPVTAPPPDPGPSADGDADGEGEETASAPPGPDSAPPARRRAPGARGPAVPGPVPGVRGPALGVPGPVPAADRSAMTDVPPCSPRPPSAVPMPEEIPTAGAGGSTGVRELLVPARRTGAAGGADPVPGRATPRSAHAGRTRGASAPWRSGRVRAAGAAPSGRDSRRPTAEEESSTPEQGPGTVTAGPGTATAEAPRLRNGPGHRGPRGPAPRWTRPFSRAGLRNPAPTDTGVRLREARRPRLREAPEPRSREAWKPLPCEAPGSGTAVRGRAAGHRAAPRSGRPPPAPSAFPGEM